MRRNRPLLVVFVFMLSASLADAQKKPPASPESPEHTAERALKLVKEGDCATAEPLLRKSIARILDPVLKRKAGTTGVRCGLALNDRDAVLEVLRRLEQAFPDDPEILYLSTHAYSDLSLQASQELARAAPASAEAHQLNAEAFEMQGKWDDAAKEYRWILEHYPSLPGTHFRLGRILLSEPNPPADAREQAKTEFEQELHVDPQNAGAEYILGEIARQGEDWTTATEHFAKATELDGGFGDAFLALGTSYISLGKFGEAVAPLERAVKLEPNNPAGHYQLAIAYARVGRREDAAREKAAHQTALEQANKILHPEEQRDNAKTPQ